MPREISTRPVTCERGRFNRCGRSSQPRCPCDVSRIDCIWILRCLCRLSVDYRSVRCPSAGICRGPRYRRGVSSTGGSTLLLIINYKNQLRKAPHRHRGCELRPAAVEPAASQVTGRISSQRSQLVAGSRGGFRQFFATATGIAAGGAEFGAAAGGRARSKTFTASRATCGAKWA